jgi:Sec-independent protein secretion pathway component TatC
MKYVNKIVTGLIFVGLSFSIGFGLIAVIGGILAPDAPVISRVALAIGAALAFVLGYLSEGGDEPAEENSAKSTQ